MSVISVIVAVSLVLAGVFLAVIAAGIRRADRASLTIPPRGRASTLARRVTGLGTRTSTRATQAGTGASTAAGPQERRAA